MKSDFTKTKRKTLGNNFSPQGSLNLNTQKQNEKGNGYSLIDKAFSSLSSGSIGHIGEQRLNSIENTRYLRSENL